VNAPAVIERTDATAVPEPHDQRSVTRTFWLLLTGAVLLLVYLPTVRWLFDRWTMGVWNNAHGMLIPLVVGYFVYQELGRVRHLPAASSPWGFLFVIPALAMHVLDTGMNTQLLSAASIVVLLPGLSLLFLGPARTRAIAFPLAFLALMLPIPLAATESLHLALRKIATAGTAPILPLLGITAYVEGTTFHLADATLQVGDACSGFSTLYAACAVAALTAYSCPTPRRRVLVLLAAAPLAVASNILRIVILVAVVAATGTDVLSTWVHPASGMLTFALSLPVILWLGTPRARSAKPAPEVTS
jgi:exosortase